MKEPFSFESEATFSPCSFYLWSLKRKFSHNKSSIIFIGLNPSKASERSSNHTLRRFINFTYAWDYGSLKVINLVIRVISSPLTVRRWFDQVGKKNDQVLISHALAWSQNPSYDLWL